MDHGGHFCAMVSEEEENIIHVPAKPKIGKYVLLFDPLDGSLYASPQKLDKNLRCKILN